MSTEERIQQITPTLNLPLSSAELAEAAAITKPRAEGRPMIRVERLKRTFGKVQAELLIIGALGVIFVSWAALSFRKQD